MKMYTPQGVEAEVAPNQVGILLGAGWTWTKEKKVAKVKEVKETEPEDTGDGAEEKKLKRILKPKE